ncbi:MAG: tRNA-queuosine alpha-mannosyltransferase domain-containing protein [Phycisphaeraceae bacterium]
MRILALQPYNAMSHRAFLEGWQRNSRHTIDVMALPGRHFKWRMRQAPVGFANLLAGRSEQPPFYDALWCTSMLDLATLRGISREVQRLPAAVYFHENQLTYPTRYEGQRDLHFGLTNMTTALAAIESCQSVGDPCVWWNSAYNRDSFLDALNELIKTMPDEQPAFVVERIRRHSAVHYPGIDPVEKVPARDSNEPPLLLWAARWEYDKGPERFFEALELLDQRGIAFRLSVIGEQFAEAPTCFKHAQERFADRIVRWGYQQEKSAYEAALSEADIIVSTSTHEFFGLAVAEAVSAGCTPVLPNALAYPEVWAERAIYHDQTAESVASAIEQALQSDLNRDQMRGAAERLAWSHVAPQLDRAIETLVSGT